MSLPRILFVDDDADVLGGLSKALRKHRERWNMMFVLGGPEALVEVRRGAFDAVISDMRMPELDGAGLLIEVRDHDPTTFRMILSGFSEPNATTRALPVAHQFFEKPCDLKALAVALDTACRLRAVFGSAPMQTLIDRLARVATPTDAAVDPDSAASARTLRLAASVFLGTEGSPAGPQGSAARALAALARARLEGPIPGFSMDALKLHSAAVAERAQQAIATPSLASHAFMTGLVHQVGTAMIAVGLPADHAAIERGIQSGGERCAVERARLGVTRAELTAFMLTLWGVPLAVIEAVASQGSEELAPSPLSLALRTALAA